MKERFRSPHKSIKTTNNLILILVVRNITTFYFIKLAIIINVVQYQSIFKGVVSVDHKMVSQCGCEKSEVGNKRNNKKQ